MSFSLLCVEIQWEKLVDSDADNSSVVISIGPWMKIHALSKTVLATLNKKSIKNGTKAKTDTPEVLARWQT